MKTYPGYEPALRGQSGAVKPSRLYVATCARMSCESAGAWVGLVTVKRYRDWSRLRYPEDDRLLQFVRSLRLDGKSTIFTVPSA